MIKLIFNKPISILMLTVTIFIFGFISLYNLPVQLMPSGKENVIAIITNYHGVSCEQIEKVITIPIENAIGGLEGIKKIYSVSESGKSKVIIYFHPGVNIDYTALRVREAIEGVAAFFPKAAEKPFVVKNDPEDRPIFIINLKSENMSLTDLRVYAENKIKKELSRIDGVSEIEFSGGGIKEIHIDVDPSSLMAYRIPITQLGSLIQEAYFVNSQGKIKEYNKETVLYTDARFTSLNEISMLPIKYDKDKKSVVLLNNIADVYEGIREKENISRLNNEERVSVYIKKVGGANTLKVCNELLKYVQNNSGGKILFEVIYNQGEYIKKAIDNVKTAALLGGIIAIIVLFFFMREIKAMFLICLSIPFSVIMTFFLMYLFKLEINIMTLSGLALGIGMLLDNSVVMLEYLALDLKTGEWKHSEKAISPIISSTLTTVAIFAPITFLNYEFRRLYGGLALTVTFSLFASIISAIMVIPAGYGFFNKIGILNIEDRDTKFSLFFIKKSMKIIKQAWKRGKVLFIIIIMLFLSLPILIIKMDKEYLDPAKGDEITAYVEMEAGTSLQETERIVQSVEKIFMQEESIKRVNSRIQKWHADIDIKYDSRKFKSQEKFIKYLKTKTDSLKDCFIHYEEKSEGETRVIDIDIVGDNDETLRSLAKEVSKEISEIQGVREVVLKFKEGKPTLTWVIDRNKCQQFLVPITSAGEQLRWALYGPVALKYIKDNREIDLRIGYKKEDKKSLEDFKRMFIYSSNQDKIYIKDLGEFVEEREPGKIYRLNKRKSVRIGVNLMDISLSKAFKKIKERLNQIKIPDGYYFDFGEKLEQLKESQSVAIFAILLSIFIIFSLLAIQFESFLLPLIIIPVIPISASFSIFLLFIFKMSLNLSVYIGLIVLAGVVVNNTILITDGIKNSKVINRFSIYRIINNRLKPVYITTLTTVLALIPMIFQTQEGSELWRPLAITLAGGLIYGTFVNLIIYPLIFFRKK